MRRDLVLPVLLLCLLTAFAWLTDRSLVSESRSRERVALGEARETAQLAALSLRATIAELEVGVVADKPSASVRVQWLAPPPLRVPVHGKPVPYSARPPHELLGLLRVPGTSASRLPKAVVAALALERRGAPYANLRKIDVTEELLEGRLSVLPEDVSHLARVLGAGDDPRVEPLVSALRRAPSMEAFPEFQRKIMSGSAVDRAPSPGRASRTSEASSHGHPLPGEEGTGSHGFAIELLEGWTRHQDGRLRYEVPTDTLLGEASVPPRVELAWSERAPGAMWARVPGVEGMSVTVDTEVLGRLGLIGLRMALWSLVLVAMCGVGVVARARHEVREPVPEHGLAVGDVRFDFGALTAAGPHGSLALTTHDILVMKTLAERRGEVVPRIDIIEEVSGLDSEATLRTVDNHIVALRRAIGDDPREPKWLHTVRGIGYRLSSQGHSADDD